MKPYTGEALCPKCQSAWGAHKAKPTYCDGLSCKILSTETETIRQGGEVIAIKRIPPTEHLHCTCQNCGYEWLMECADAKSAFEQLQEINDKINPEAELVDTRCPSCDASVSYWCFDGEWSLKEWSMHGEEWSTHTKP